MDRKKLAGILIAVICLASLAGSILPISNASIKLESKNIDAIKQWHGLDNIDADIESTFLDLNTLVCITRIYKDGLFENTTVRFASEKGNCLASDRDEAIKAVYDRVGKSSTERLAIQQGKEEKIGKGKVTITAK